MQKGQTFREDDPRDLRYHGSDTTPVAQVDPEVFHVGQ